MHRLAKRVRRKKSVAKFKFLYLGRSANKIHQAKSWKFKKDTKDWQSTVPAFLALVHEE